MRSRLHLVLILVAALWSCAGIAQAASFNPLGGPAPSPETLRGYEQLYAGDDAAANESFTRAVSKNKAEFAALYGLSLHAKSLNDCQKAAELLGQALSAAGNSPWAESYLEELLRLRPYCGDSKPFMAEVTRAMSDTALRPLVRDLARAAYGEYLAQRGDFAAAAAAFIPLQYVTRWALAGPFDNRDRSGFPTAYEPEKGIDFNTPMPGRNRSVKWFRSAAAPYDGRMDLAEVFEPNTHSLAYALCLVKADEAGWRVLRVGCAGACAVWINERPVGKIEQYNDFGPDKLAAPVYLHKGWNQLLLKSAVVEETEWAFAARFCNPEGGPATGLSFDTSAEALAAYAQEGHDRPAPGPQPERVELGLLPLLEEALKKTPDEVSLLAAYGMLLDAGSYGEKEVPPAPKQLARAVALAPRCPDLRLKLAAVSDDCNEARQAAEAACALRPDMPAALEALAALAQESRNFMIASDYARRLQAKVGTEKLAFAALILADALSGYAAAGSPEYGQLAPVERGKEAKRGGSPDTVGARDHAEACRLVDSFVERHPYLPEGWLRLAELAASHTERRAILQRALAACGGNERLRELWAEELAAAGKDLEAAEFLASGLVAQPCSTKAVLRAARQFERAGLPQRATQLIEDACLWAPENTGLLSALGELRHREGRNEQAVALFREVLKLKPNSPHIKDYLAVLDLRPGADKRFFAPYDIALKDLAVPAPAAYPGDNVVNLLNQEVVRVDENGSSSRMVHRIAKLLRPAGFQELARHFIYYEPARQVVEVLRAAVITPDGRELSRAEVRDNSTSAMWGVQTKIYDEYFVKQVLFKNLEPGAMIDLQYTVRDTGSNIYGDYFAGLFYLSEDKPTLKCQYVLDYPKNLSIQTRTFNTKVEAQHLAGSDPKREVVKWELDNTPGLPAERYMPPVRDQLALLQITTMRSWQEVGQWYWHLVQDQLACSPEMKTTVESLVKDCRTPLEKLRAIHAWVIHNIRYLGIEFGRYGYRPRKASETFKARHGDCKETATLLTAMLQATGIDSKLVLLHTVNLGALPPDSLPLPNLFNHCIAFVPQVEGRDYWVDCTADFHHLNEVPWPDQGAQVLVSDSAGGQFMRIPVAGPQENLVEQHFRARLERTGSATIQIHEVRHGQWAPGYRQFAETPGKYESYMQDQAAKHFNGAELKNLELAPPGDPGPMWMKATMNVPALATQSGERKALPAALELLNLSHYAGENKRKCDLELNFPWERKTEIVYELDKGLKFASLPEEAEINEPFGTYRRRFCRKDSTLEIQEELVLPRHRVPVQDYEAFKNFCNRIDSLMDQKILLDTK
ncbi:MAG: DUF3857 domain-containing protein [Planctomycetota bacterium]